MAGKQQLQIPQIKIWGIKVNDSKKHNSRGVSLFKKIQEMVDNPDHHIVNYTGRDCFIH